jgi:hypothetical protein
VLGAAAVAVVAAIAVVTVIVIGRSGKPPAQAGSIATQPTTVATTLPGDDPTTVDTTPPDTTQPTEASSADDTTTENDALAELERLSDEGRSAVSFEGQYTAQIASKYPGIADPLQTTATGSHTFGATDILDEHVALRDAHGSTAHPVILLKSTDYGKRQMIGPHFLWVTFAIGDFPDRHAVLSWCAAEFPELSAQERENQCAVRRLEPGR